MLGVSIDIPVHLIAFLLDHTRKDTILSGLKNTLIQQMDDEEDKQEWIRKQLDDPTADESSAEWSKQSDIYDSVVEQSTRRDNNYNEIPWLFSTPPKDPYANFKAEILVLLRIVKGHPTDGIMRSYLKMTFAYSITLLESYLEDTLKINIATNYEFRYNAINKIEELKRSKFTLAEFSAHENDIDSLIFRELSSLMYHNIPKITRIYGEVFDQNIDFKFGSLVKIIATRHDIVHRNGKSENGEKFNPSEEDVLQAIKVVTNYVDKIETLVNAARYASDPPF